MFSVFPEELAEMMSRVASNADGEWPSTIAFDGGPSIQCEGLTTEVPTKATMFDVSPDVVTALDTTWYPVEVSAEAMPYLLVHMYDVAAMWPFCLN